MKKLLLAFSFLLFTTSAFAQSANASWGQSEAPTVANGFTYTLKVDALAPVTLTQTCVVQGTGSVCTAPFTLTNPTATHTYVLTASNSFGSASITLGPGAPPGTSGFKVIVTVTITQP